jgi:arylsulfatase A-like enzyme
MAPYEESSRVPFVVAGPGVRTGTDERFVLNNDLAPTLLDLAGLPTDDLDGRSLAPLFGSDDVTWRDDLLIQYHGTYHPLIPVHTLEDVQRLVPDRANVPPDEHQLAFVPTYRALRNERWLYVEWYAGDEHEYELYDLRADPFQLTNVLASPAGQQEHESTREMLQTRLEELASCSGRSCRE